MKREKRICVDDKNVVRKKKRRKFSPCKMNDESFLKMIWSRYKLKDKT